VNDEELKGLEMPSKLLDGFKEFEN